MPCKAFSLCTMWKYVLNRSHYSWSIGYICVRLCISAKVFTWFSLSNTGLDVVWLIRACFWSSINPAWLTKIQGQSDSHLTHWLWVITQAHTHKSIERFLFSCCHLPANIQGQRFTQAQLVVKLSIAAAGALADRYLWMWLIQCLFRPFFCLCNIWDIAVDNTHNYSPSSSISLLSLTQKLRLCPTAPAASSHQHGRQSTARR